MEDGAVRVTERGDLEGLLVEIHGTEVIQALESPIPFLLEQMSTSQEEWSIEARRRGQGGKLSA